MIDGWQWLEAADFDRVLSLRQQVLDALLDADHYVRESDEAGFVADHLTGRGRSLGLVVDGELIAYAALTTALSDADVAEYTALDAGPGDCILAASMVHPAARGNRHQRTSIRLRLALARELGFRRALVEVSMRNTASIASLLAEGALLSAAVEYGDGRRRYLFVCDVVEDSERHPVTDVLRDVEFLSCDDWDGSRAALRAGRVGRGVVTRRDGHYIVVSAR